MPPTKAVLLRANSLIRQDHFYTTKPEEIEALKGEGYETYPTGSLEFPVGYIFQDHGKDTVPLFVLFNSKVNDHFYTISSAEKEEYAHTKGYTYQGIVGYVYASHVHGAVPVYTAYNASWTDHLYTQKLDEIKNAVGLGYGTHKTAFYVLPS